MSHGLPFLSRSRRRPVLSRAVARWRAGNYASGIDALIDESGNGQHARLGSGVGADSNDPVRLAYGGAKHVYFSGVSGNNLSVPRPVASVSWEAFFDDDTSALATTTADPIVFGNADAAFAGKRLVRLVLTNTTGGALVGELNCNLLAEPYASYTDPQGNVWTINRSTSGRRLAVVDRDMTLGDDGDYIVAPTPNIALGLADYTIVAAVRCPHAIPAAAAAWGFYTGPSATVSAGADSLYPYIATDGTLFFFKRSAADVAQSIGTVANFITTYAGQTGLLVVRRRLGRYQCFFRNVMVLDTTTRGAENVSCTYVGAAGGNASVRNGAPWYGSAVFLEALTDDDLRRLAIEMGVPS